MTPISRERLKRYWPLIVFLAALVGVGLKYLYEGWTRASLQSTSLATEVRGQLVIKENGVTVSSAPLATCVGTPFGPQFYVKENEGVGFALDLEKKNRGITALRPMVDYYQPPTGGRYYGRPCTFSASEIEEGYPADAFWRINLLVGRRGFKDRGRGYWSGSLRAECLIENERFAPSGRSLEVNVDFKNCKPEDPPRE